MKKTIFIIICAIITIPHISSQSLEKVIKKNQSIVCYCIQEIDHIDSEEDLELKFQSCIEPNEIDAIQLQKNGNLNDYQKRLETALWDNCSSIEMKLQTLMEDYKTSLSNYRYDLEKPYKEVEEKVIGGYSLAFGHHSPEGSAKLFIYPGNKYAIISFGEVQSGTWRIVKEKYLHLIPAKSKYPFTVYGRHNPKTKDSTKTSFLGDDFSYSTLIHYGELKEKPLLTPIFNMNANCFDFPYKGTINKVYSTISLAYNKGYGLPANQEIDIHSFNNAKKFNDFVIFEHTRMNDRSPTVVVTIGDDTLIFRKDKVTSKSSLDNISDDNNVFLTEIMKAKEIPSFVYRNPGYKGFDQEEINSDLYTYDKELNTYISIEECTYDCLEDDYHNFTQVHKYELLEDITTHKKQFEIAEKSVIYTVCD